MRYRYIYKYKTGLTKVKTRLAIAFSILGLGAGGVIGSVAIFGSAHALAPNWQLNAPNTITFVCGGGNYNHTLQSVSEDSTTGSFTGTGNWNDNVSYTWDVTGSVSGNDITFQLIYSGGNPGYTLNGIGTIENDGSISGTVDNNCQTFSMPAGSATAITQAPTCTPVSTSNKGTLTAAQVGGDVTSDLNATGCDIGVYYDGSIPGSVSDGATIHDATMYGVFVDKGASVDVSDSTITNVGDHPTFSGNQYGVGVYYTDGASGSVSGNTINLYQKNGVAITGDGTSATVNNNTVTGNGQVPNIAQNGIEFGFGATGSARGNTIDGNWYTGADWTATGMLLFNVNANQVKASMNLYRNNQTNHAVVTTQACPHMYGGFYETYGLCTTTP